MKVGIVAGEKSGDYLGAELIRSLKLRYPEAEFVGLCGPLMQSEGAQTLAEMDKISIMGFVEVIPAIRDILSIRKKLKNYFLEWIKTSRYPNSSLCQPNCMGMALRSH